MNVKDKILEYIEYKGITLYSVEKRLGWSHYSIMSSKSIKSERLCEFIRVYDDISLDWLFRDEGPMLREIGTKDRIPADTNEIDIKESREFDPDSGLTTSQIDRLDREFQIILLNATKAFSDRIEYYKRKLSKLEEELKYYKEYNKASESISDNEKRTV